MKYIEWNYNNELVVPMIETDGGELLILAKTAASVLGCSQQAFSKLLANHAEELSNCTTLGCPNWSTKTLPIEFLRAHRDEFQLKYIRSDMRMLTEDDFITLAVLVRSPQGRAMRRGFVQFIKDNVRKNCVTQAQFDDLLGRFVLLEQEVRSADPFLSKSASLAGSLLAAQRGTKGIRTN